MPGYLIDVGAYLLYLKYQVLIFFDVYDSFSNAAWRRNFCCEIPDSITLSLIVLYSSLVNRNVIFLFLCSIETPPIL